jgi:hypothetical protein
VAAFQDCISANLNFGDERSDVTGILSKEISKPPASGTHQEDCASGRVSGGSMARSYGIAVRMLEFICPAADGFNLSWLRS